MIEGILVQIVGISYQEPYVLLVYLQNIAKVASIALKSSVLVLKHLPYVFDTLTQSLLTKSDGYHVPWIVEDFLVYSRYLSVFLKLVILQEWPIVLD